MRCVGCDRATLDPLNRAKYIPLRVKEIKTVRSDPVCTECWKLLNRIGRTMAMPECEKEQLRRIVTNLEREENNAIASDLVRDVLG